MLNAPARILDARTIEVAGEVFRARALVLALGSEPIHLEVCDATFRQVWNWDNFFIAGIGTTSASGKCLSVLSAGTAAGTPVQLLQCNGTVGQIWYFSGGHVVNPNSGKCLDVGNALFTPATIQNCIFTGSPPKGQIWVIR